MIVCNLPRWSVEECFVSNATKPKQTDVSFIDSADERPR